MRFPARAVLLAAIAAAVVLVLAFTFLRTERRGELRPTGGAHDRATGLLDLQDAIDAPGASRAVDRAAGTGLESRFPDPSARPGALEVLVVDDATGDPLAGMDLVVHRERGGDRLLARGTTDAEGRARFDAVEANTVLVESARRPPYARAFGAVWLEPGELQRVVLRAGPGAQVTGRVVDETGLPIADAAILLDEEIAPRFGPRESVHATDRVAARSGADGRFLVEHVAASPREVWIEHGAMAPRRWEPVHVSVRVEDAVEERATALDERASADVGDVVIARARTWAGRVVDAEGSGVEGALVSTLPARRVPRGQGQRRADEAGWPGLAGVRLLDGEAWTGTGGAFELRARGTPTTPLAEVGVRTRDAALHLFPLPRLEAGARADGLELRLRTCRVLAIEALDAAGERITRPPDWARRAHMLGSDLRLLSGAMHVEVALRGQDFGDYVLPDPDGLFRLQLDEPASSGGTVQVELAGYRPVRRALDDDPREVVRVALEPFPVLRLRLDVAAQTLGSIVPSLALHACSRAGCVRDAGRDASSNCGGTLWIDSLTSERSRGEVLLPVATTEAVFVDARDAFGGRWSASFGPWTSGPEVHAISVPDLGGVQSPLPDSTDRFQHLATVRARLVDAVTGEDLAGTLILEDAGGDQGVGAFPVNLTGRDPGTARAPSGTWRVRATSRGHRDSADWEVHLAADAEHDLGVVPLEPLAAVRITVLGPDGRPADGVALLLLATGEDGPIAVPRGSEPGRFDHFDGLPDGGIAVVRVMTDPVLDYRVQLAPLERTARDAATVRMSAWRQLEVHVRGAAAGADAGALRATIVQLDERGVAVPATQRRLPERIAAAGERRFSGQVGAGRFTVQVEGARVEATSVEVEIGGEDTEPVHVELAPAPR